MFHLLSVGKVIIVLEKAHDCCVICKLHDVVSSGPGAALASHQGEQQRTQDAALRGAGAQGDDNAVTILSSSPVY